MIILTKADIVQRLKEFPFPSYLQDIFITLVGRVFPLLLVLCYLYTVVNIVRSLIHEKELRIREAMKMMGLSNWVLWSSWWIKNIIFLLISNIAITIILSGGKVLQATGAGMTLFFLFLFSLSLISYCFMLSTLFSKASVGSAIAAFLFFLGYFPYLFQESNIDNLTHSAKLAMCLSAPSCLGLGASILSRWESQGIGLHAYNVGKEVSIGDPTTMGNIFGMLFFDSILYLIITWYVSIQSRFTLTILISLRYIDAVFPGQYGVPRPPLFFLDRTYWFGVSKPKNSAATPGIDFDVNWKFLIFNLDETILSENFEADPSVRWSETNLQCNTT